MATAPNVIPRSKATWESPKKERKTQWRLPPTALVLAISTAQKIFAISSSRDKNSCHSFARLSAWCSVLRTQADKRTLIQSVLIHGMCNFEDGTRAARRRAKRMPSLTDSTSDCAVLLRSWRTKRSGITRGRYLSMRVLSVAPRGADAVGSLLRGGNGGMGTTR